MTKATISVNGGAMSINREDLMSRAWAIFRQTFHYPQIKFASIGRHCFAWALKRAWAEVKEAARIAALDVAIRQTRISTLTRSIELEQFNDIWPLARSNVARMQAEVARLKGGAAATM